MEKISNQIIFYTIPPIDTIFVTANPERGAIRPYVPSGTLRTKSVFTTMDESFPIS